MGFLEESTERAIGEERLEDVFFSSPEGEDDSPIFLALSGVDGSIGTPHAVAKYEIPVRERRERRAISFAISAGG